MSNARNSNKLEHSDKAISVLNQFHNVLYVVYVEGDDDITYWNDLFSRAVSTSKYRIEALGGINDRRMQEYISKVKNNSIKNTIIACDADYTLYLDEFPYDSPYIINTYGYSIENSMYCPYHIADYLSRISRSTENFTDAVNNWYSSFCNSALRLLPYDIVNFIKGQQGSVEDMSKVLGDNCARFLKDGKSADLDDGKINEEIERIKDNYNPDELRAVEEAIDNDFRENRFKLRGHFLTKGVMNLISQEALKRNHRVTLTKDQLYAEFVQCNIPCSLRCEARDLILEKIKKIFK